MKRLLFAFYLIFSCLVIKSQNVYIAGLKCFDKGEYLIADSLFSIYLKDSPKDMNAHYNHGVTRLYLKDTCGFCEEMHLVTVFNKDKTAKGLYLKVCASIDTLFYDKLYVRCDKSKMQYTEIAEKSKCDDFKTVTVHDKKSRGKTILINSADLMHSQATDVVAQYRLYSNNNKVFIFCLDQPVFPGGDDAKTEFRNNSPLILETMREFKLKKTVAQVEYVIDKNGFIRDVNLTSVDAVIDQMDKFKENLNLIITSMPRHTPARYRDENVDYLVNDFISFW